MSAPAVVLSGLLLGLWPFGGDDAKQPAGGVGSITGEASVPDTGGEVRPDLAQAREHYARYLELETGGDPEFRAVALRRLGDLTLEEAEAEQVTLGPTPLVQARLDEAARYYRDFLAEFPEDPAAVRVRYQLARALELGGENLAALSELDTLVAEGGDDPLLPEAQFRRGETLFVQKRWGEAESAYLAVMERGPESDFAEQATYKHGWALFKQGRHEESLVSFFTVLDGRLDGAEPDLAAMDRPARELVEDTMRAVSIGFTYMDGSDSLVEYLDSRPVPIAYERLLYEQLGDLYLEQERYQDAAKTFSAYVATHADSDGAPAMQVRVIDAYRAGEFPMLVLEGKIEFVELFGPDGSYWDLRSPSDLPAAHAYLRLTLGELARHFHAVAQAGGEPSDYLEAARWYRRFLAAFPDDPEAPEHHFLLAEVLFEAGRYHEAAIAYEETAYGYLDHGRAAEAGYAALLAWRALSTAEPDGGWREQAIPSALRFARTFPQDEHAVAVQTDASKELFELGRLEEAVAEASVIALAEGEIDPAYRKTALLVVGHASFDLEDFSTAETAYLRVGVLLEPTDEERPRVRERLAAAVYSQGRGAAAEGDVDTAVAHYLRVKNLVPESPVAATADYDAAMLLVSDQQWDRAAAQLTDFRARYPDHAFQNQVTINLAAAWTEAGKPTAAASELVKVSRIESEDAELRRAALWQAAEMYREAGDTPAAAGVWVEYIDRYPAPLDSAMEARQSMVELNRESGNVAEERRWLEALVSADAAAGPAGTPRTHTLAARALLALAQPDLDAFNAVALTAPINQSLKRKKALMESALSGYGRAADYGITDVTTEATFYIAQIYRDFGQSLMDSERPAELDSAALEEYEFLLEEQAFPFEEQAIGIHEANAARAQLGIYDDWVEASYRELAALVPGRYARNERGQDVVHLVL